MSQSRWPSFCYKNNSGQDVKPSSPQILPQTEQVLTPSTSGTSGWCPSAAGKERPERQEGRRYGRELGATDLGAELGAGICGAECPAMFVPPQLPRVIGTHNSGRVISAT